MKIQKLTLEDALDIDFICLAIHTHLEDYQLAYHINKNLKLKLRRTKEDLDIMNGHYKFPLFEWEDLKHQTKWNLISNIITQETAKTNFEEELFGTQITQMKKQYLIPELKQVGFFLRIKQIYNKKCVSSIIRDLKKTPQIMTSYQLDLKKIKHPEHLTLE